MDGDVTTIEADNITTMEKTKSTEPMKSEMIDIEIPESEMMDTARLLPRAQMSSALPGRQLKPTGRA